SAENHLPKRSPGRGFCVTRAIGPCSALDTGWLRNGRLVTSSAKLDSRITNGRWNLHSEPCRKSVGPSPLRLMAEATQRRPFAPLSPGETNASDQRRPPV